MKIPIISKWLVGHMVNKHKYQIISIDNFKMLLSEVGLNLTHKQQNKLSQKMSDMTKINKNKK